MKAVELSVGQDVLVSDLCPQCLSKLEYSTLEKNTVLDALGIPQKIQLSRISPDYHTATITLMFEDGNVETCDECLSDEQLELDLEYGDANVV